MTAPTQPEPSAGLTVGAFSQGAASWKRRLVVGTLIAQCVVAAVTFMLGMGWGGWSYSLALVVAVASVGLVVVVGNRTSRTVVVFSLLAVPVAGAAVTLSLEELGTSLAAGAACSDQELAAVADLHSPAGRALRFVGTVEGECLATLRPSGTAQGLLDQFAEKLDAAGWVPVEGSEGRPVQVRKDGVNLSVMAVPEEGRVLLYVSDDPAAVLGPEGRA